MSIEENRSKGEVPTLDMSPDRVKNALRTIKDGAAGLSDDQAGTLIKDHDNSFLDDMGRLIYVLEKQERLKQKTTIPDAGLTRVEVEDGMAMLRELRRSAANGSLDDTFGEKEISGLMQYYNIQQKYAVEREAKETARESRRRFLLGIGGVGGVFLSVALGVNVVGERIEEQKKTEKRAYEDRHTLGTEASAKSESNWSIRHLTSTEAGLYYKNSQSPRINVENEQKLELPGGLFGTGRMTGITVSEYVDSENKQRVLLKVVMRTGFQGRNQVVLQSEEWIARSGELIMLSSNNANQVAEIRRLNSAKPNFEFTLYEGK